MQYGAPVPYGTLDCDSGFAVDEKRASVAGAFGGKGPFLRGRRRRINLLPAVLCVLGPWALFTIVSAALALSIHYVQATMCWVIVAVCFLAVVLTGAFAFRSGVRRFNHVEHDPTWLYFLFMSMLVAFLAAFVIGSSNYSANMQPYFNMKSLDNYTNVDVSRKHGQQLMDAGLISFHNHTRLDTSKSMGFKNGKIYCVAPITLGNTTLASYDFWAVGVDCCSATRADFHCPNFNNPSANGGIRAMTDADRPFYRLAVQQAEAAYSLKATHPLFFVWSVDPEATVETWKWNGRRELLICIFSYFVFQTFVVAVATLAFAKMGFS